MNSPEDVLKSRSTLKLTARIRVALLTALVACGLMLSIGGCASNSSRNWAQNSPVIAPSHSGQPIVSLGAAEHGS